MKVTISKTNWRQSASEKGMAKDIKKQFECAYTENDLIRALAAQSQKAENAFIREHDFYNIFSCEVELFGDVNAYSFDVKMVFEKSHADIFKVEFFVDENLELTLIQNECLVTIEKFSFEKRF